MSSKNESKYKKTDFLKSFFSSARLNNDIFVILTFSIGIIGFLIGFASTLKFAVPFLLIIAFVLAWRLKSLFTGFFLTSIFTFQFFSPNKYYEQEVIRSYEVSDILAFESGRSIGFGINLSNIFLLITLGFMVSEIIVRNEKSNYLLNFLKRSKIFILLSLGFLISGLGLSVPFSPYPILSSIWTIQYSQLFLVSLLVNYFYFARKIFFDLLFTTLCFIVLFQFNLSLLQFASQSATGLSFITQIERQFYYGAEEISSLFRVGGTFLYHNQLALVTNIILTLILPQIIYKRKILYLVTVICGIIILILTQSRINWLSFFVLLGLSFRFIFKNIKDFWKNPTYRRLILYSISIILIFSFVVIPRVLLTFNFLTDEGSFNLRSRMFREGFDALIENPLAGFGAGTNEAVLYSFFPDGIITSFPLPILFAPLQFLLEFGIIGTLFFVAPFYLILRRVIIKIFSEKKINSVTKKFTFYFLAGMIVVLLHYLTQNHYGVIEFSFIGLILGSGMVASQDKN